MDQLRSRSDPQLEALRAGRVGESSRLNEDERAVLNAAQERSTGLLDLRAGNGGGLLLIVAVVVLILVLI